MEQFICSVCGLNIGHEEDPIEVSRPCKECQLEQEVYYEEYFNERDPYDIEYDN